MELLDCISRGDTATARVLIKSKSDINVRDRTGHGILGLSILANLGSDFVRFLLSSNADANTSSLNGFTPLMAIASNADANIARLLLEFKADVDMPDKNGVTALMVAVSKCNTDVTQLLLESKANVKATNLNKTPILSIAVWSEDITATLIASHADINVRGNFGWTPLHIAAQLGRMATAKLLVSHGAAPSLTIRDKSSMMPLDVYNKRSNMGAFLQKMEEKYGRV
jgi:ankyrin repeat protein